MKDNLHKRNTVPCLVSAQYGGPSSRCETGSRMTVVMVSQPKIKFWWKFGMNVSQCDYCRQLTNRQIWRWCRFIPDVNSRNAACLIVVQTAHANLVVPKIITFISRSVACCGTANSIMANQKPEKRKTWKRHIAGNGSTTMAQHNGSRAQLSYFYISYWNINVV